MLDLSNKCIYFVGEMVIREVPENFFLYLFVEGTDLQKLDDVILVLGKTRGSMSQSRAGLGLENGYFPSNSKCSDGARLPWGV